MSVPEFLKPEAGREHAKKLAELMPKAQAEDSAVLKLRDAVLEFEARLPKSPDVSFAVHLNLVDTGCATADPHAPHAIGRAFKVEAQFVVTFRHAIDMKALFSMKAIADRLGFYEQRISSQSDNKAVIQFVGHFNQVDTYERKAKPEGEDWSWAGKVFEVSKKPGNNFEVTMKAASQEELDKMIQDAAKAKAKRKKK